MNKLYKAFQSITPNDFEKTNKEAQIRNNETNIYVETPKKRKYYKLSLIGLICIICIGFSFILKNNSTVFATVGIDVNPSVELNINAKEEIVEVITHNEAGQKIVGDMKLEGSHIDVGMNALIGSMLKEGYINELKNSLLISVTGNNKEENEKMRKRISQDIDELLKGNHIQGAIISQSLDKSNDLESLAQKYHISVGKAEIIQQLMKQNSKYTFESLKDLTVNDLNILLTNNKVVDIRVDGEVSTKSYMDQEKVKQIIQNDSQIKQPTYQKIELDCDDGHMVYEVEFTYNGNEYDYELDAKDGKILKKEIEKKTLEHHQDNHTSQHISQSQARTIAMNHAKVSEVSNYKIEKDNDDGVWQYEIEFVSGKNKYEYTIDAISGKVLDYEIEKIKSVKLTREQAKQKALKHAGLSQQQTRDMEIELEDYYYEVSFETSSYEYEYKIDMETGKIIDYEKEQND